MIHLYAEYDSPEALAAAIPEVRAFGPVALEAYSPYPAAAIEAALAAPRSRLSIAVLAAGLAAAAAAYGLQWLLNAYLYPLDVGGRPPHFPLAFVPITFEMGVLFASLTAFGAVLAGARLVRLWDPSREIDGIESATATRCWLEVIPLDGDAELDALVQLLHRTGARVVRRREAP